MNRSSLNENDELKDANSDPDEPRDSQPHFRSYKSIRFDSRQSIDGSEHKHSKRSKEESKGPRLRKNCSKPVPIQESVNESDNKHKQASSEYMQENTPARVVPVSIYCENAMLIHCNHGRVEFGKNTLHKNADNNGGKNVGSINHSHQKIGGSPLNLMNNRCSTCNIVVIV